MKSSIVFPNHETPEKHVQYVFDEILAHRIPQETSMYILASGYGASAICGVSVRPMYAMPYTTNLFLSILS